MKLLSTGSHGLLGTNILPILERYFTIIPYDIEEWDITDRDAGERAIQEIRPDIILNLAAYTNVDDCEDYLSLADDLYRAGRLKESREMYQTVATVSSSLYRQAEKYFMECNLHEDSLDQKSAEAMLAHQEGRLDESKKMWEDIVNESVPRPLSFEF